MKLFQWSPKITEGDREQETLLNQQSIWKFCHKGKSYHLLRMANSLCKCNDTFIPSLNIKKVIKCLFEKSVTLYLGCKATEVRLAAWQFCFGLHHSFPSLCGVYMITSAGQHDSHTRPVCLTHSSTSLCSLKANK